MSQKVGFALVGAIVAAVLILSMATVASEDAQKPDEGVFIHVMSGPGKPHAVLMALQMAKIMSESKEVLIYFDVNGIEALRKDAADLNMEPFGSSNAAIGELVAKGVTVMACPGCMKAKGITQEDLAEGVQVAEKDAFFDFTAGRILSLTY